MQKSRILLKLRTLSRLWSLNIPLNHFKLKSIKVQFCPQKPPYPIQRAVCAWCTNNIISCITFHGSVYWVNEGHTTHAQYPCLILNFLYLIPSTAYFEQCSRVNLRPLIIKFAKPLTHLTFVCKYRVVQKNLDSTLEICFWEIVYQAKQLV